MRALEHLRRGNVLLRLRRRRHIARLLERLDRAVWVRPAGVSRRIRLKSVSHVSYYALPAGPEPEIAAALIAFVREIPTTGFVDVGANFGYYSWLLDAHAPHALEIHLIEPDPANVALIESTLGRHRLTSAKLHTVALSDFDGEAVFHRDLATGHAGSLGEAMYGFRDEPGGSVSVNVRRLDSVVSQVGSSEVEALLIKIDVEGGEAQVLAGAEQILGGEPVLMLECFDRGPSAAWRRLESMPNYRLFDAVTFEAPHEGSTNFFAVPDRVTSTGLAAVRRTRDMILAAGRLPRH